MLSENIKKLVQYGVESGLMPECERIYATNLLLECFKEEFVRISRNEYVNFSYVDSIEGKNMILTNGVRCMISRARVKEVTEICCLRFSSVNSKGKIIFLASKCAKCNIKRT